MWKYKIVALVVTLTVGMTSSMTVFASEAALANEKRKTPVIVELFTSQGCSSCPPADRILRRLIAKKDPSVIPLSFHVDYWDYIGWTDPFSSKLWSERQTGYAHQVFSTNRIYTPQVVVNGRTECVGSNEILIREQIKKARKRAADGELKLGELKMTAANEGQVPRLDLTIEALVRREAPGHEWNVMVAVFENDLVTPVERGENGGRTIKNSGVVRKLEQAFTLPANSGSRRSEQIEIELGDDWKRSNLGVAVFLQDPKSLEIHGAAVRRLGS